jgi:hypothetical protein
MEDIRVLVNVSQKNTNVGIEACRWLAGVPARHTI